MENYTPPIHYYLKTGGNYILRDQGKIHVDAEANRAHPELIRLKDENGTITLLHGEWNDEKGHYEYTVEEGLSAGGEDMKNVIERIRRTE